MNSNYRQGKGSGMIVSLLAMLAAAVISAGVVTPAQAQTFPIAFPAPTTFALGTPPCCPSTVAVATGTSTETASWMSSTLTAGSDLNVMLGKGDGTFQAPITRRSP